MTAKHYNAIAAFFASLEKSHGKTERETDAAQAIREIIAGELADYFESENKLFQKERFLLACKIPFFESLYKK